jgi:hypothetical protein
VEPFLLIVEGWWWVVPTAAGAGTATYAGLTTRRRRARRLELDAARHEESHAHRAWIAARARVSEAQANVLAARAASGSPSFGPALLEAALSGSPFTGSPETIEAKRQLQAAKLAERSAALALRASRARVKATAAHYHAASGTDPLPIENLFAAHDAVVARWMVYETDPTKSIDYPLLSDARHPATIAFFVAQREAQQLRPASARDRIPPQQFLDYRNAVRALEAAFDEAERQAGAAKRPPLPRTGIWPVPGWRPTRPPAAQ